MNVFPTEIARLGPLVVTDTVPLTLLVSALLVLVGALVRWSPTAREVAEVVYQLLERAITDMVAVDARPLVPLVLTQWLFIGTANLLGTVPRLASPTRDLALAAALATIAFLAGHFYAMRAHGLRYLRQYVEPNPLLLPFNIVGEASRTVALALRLFGNVLSGQLIVAIAVYLVALLVPVPLMALGVLTSVVQAYIFGVLTLVFTASSLQAAERRARGGST